MKRSRATRQQTLFENPVAADRLRIKRLCDVTETLNLAQEDIEAAMDAFDFDTETEQWGMLSEAAEAIQKAQTGLRFYCVGCNKDTWGGEYYMVRNDVWSASGLGGNDGMLCLRCCEQRIGRELRPDDFTAVCPSKEAWQRHVATRQADGRGAFGENGRREP